MLPPFSLRLRCILPRARWSRFPQPALTPLPDHPTPARQRRPPAHGDQVPTLHGHIAGRRFLGGQPQSHGGLDKARFHPDVRQLLPLSAALHPARRPGPCWITAGPSARRGPLTPPRPSHCPCAWCPAPRPPPRRRFRSKMRPVRELSEVLSRGPSPPSPSRPPHSAGDVKALGPRPLQAGDQSAEGAGFEGRGEAWGPRKGGGASPEKAAIGRREKRHLICSPLPHSGPGIPRFASLSSDDFSPLLLTCD